MPREVIAWNIGSRHNKELITTTLLDAIGKREKSPNIFHSDQGSEYRSDELANILKKQNIKASMSKKSSPWQNGFERQRFISGKTVLTAVLSE